MNKNKTGAMAPLIQNVYAFESVIIINNYLNLTKLAEKRKEWNTNWVRNDSFSGQYTKSILFQKIFSMNKFPPHSIGENSILVWTWCMCTHWPIHITVFRQATTLCRYKTQYPTLTKTFLHLCPHLKYMPNKW